MTNHFHLMLRSKEQSISKVMSLINNQYADYYNNCYRLNGHLFENRFFSKEIRDDQGILEVNHYIHRNPLEAKMVKDLEDYKWSSFPLYMNHSQKVPLYTNMQTLFRYFAGSSDEKRKKYLDFCMEERE